MVTPANRLELSWYLVFGASLENQASLPSTESGRIVIDCIAEGVVGVAVFGGTLVGSNTPSPSPLQASPDTSKKPKSNTIAMLVVFIVSFHYLPINHNNTGQTDIFQLIKEHTTTVKGF
jgi:hypothetical protein